jgi:cytochrome c556
MYDTTLIDAAAGHDGEPMMRGANAGSRRRNRFAGLAGAVIATVIGASSVFGQDQGANLSAPPAEDTIFARKILMDSIGFNMDEIETMTSSSDKISLLDARNHADVISVMLQAFPHLFAPATNQWKPNVERDAATDTFAPPNAWTHYSDFYKRADAASNIALDASRAATESDFRTLAAKLRAACDSCHSAYQEPG